jgi:peptidoglycan/xylan/chitin deacetylase (PgdA/CDA1 family)
LKRSISSILLAFLFAATLLGCSFQSGQKDKEFSVNLKGNGLVVLCYHRIIPDQFLKLGRSFDPKESELAYYTIGTDEFASQLKYLKQYHVRFLTPQQAQDYLTGKQKFSGKLVLITLDDGDLSIYKDAYPRLKQLGIPFLLFMIAGQAGKQWEGFNMLTWGQMKEMEKSGCCTVGLHTYNMHFIDSQTNQPVFLNKNKKKQFDDDTKKGIASLKQHLGTNTIYFAYPYGFGNPDTDQILMSHGINNIFTLSGKVNHTGDKQFYIGRFLVTSDDWKQIKSWVQSK